jgi:hypothetical protein
MKESETQKSIRIAYHNLQKACVQAAKAFKKTAQLLEKIQNPK